MTEDFKSDRINFEPTLYKGCTLHELMALAALSFGINITLFLAICLSLWGNALLGLAVAIPLGFFGMLIAANFLGQIKQNKPQGYYLQKMTLWLEDHGLFKTPYVRQTGTWSVRRAWR